MAGTWKPKHPHLCARCDWKGVRAVTARSCPKCGHWHPQRVEKQGKAKPAAKLKLSPAQARVMQWISQGWGARVSHGAAVEINSQRMCNVDTMTTLTKLGLVERDPDSRMWVATAEGRKLTPSYRPVEGEEP